jgi:hypothetical protein
MANVHMLESPEYRKRKLVTVMTMHITDVLRTCKSNRGMMTNVMDTSAVSFFVLH